MIKYEKDEDGFIADSNLSDEQMVNFKLPKLIHGKIESFSYLTLEMEFKKQIKKLNNQFIICSLKEIEQVRNYLNQEDNQGNIIGMHFLSHSFELFLFDKKGATISREEYDFEYVSEKAGENFFFTLKIINQMLMINGKKNKNYPLKYKIDIVGFFLIKKCLITY